jgi:multisubunit Na+/H+ antiporter MnhB subunit
MTVLLMLSMAAGLGAAGLDSPGLGLIAGAALLWATALYICAGAPVVAQRGHPVNESLAEGLSIVAAILCGAGTLLVLLAAL